jgi:hypothetical protein
MPVGSNRKILGELSGIILCSIYAFIIRILAEFNIIEINSITFLLITPAVLSFIPFIVCKPNYYNKTWKVTLYPILSILIFLLIAVIRGLEDLACFLIIGIPYCMFSIATSLLLKYFVKKKRNINIKNSFSILLLPLIVGTMENKSSKIEVKHIVSNEILIQENKDFIFQNLLSVPDISQTNKKSFINYLGIPKPIKSSYDTIKNIRIGYFENNVSLTETVEQNFKKSKLTFKILLSESKFAQNPTLKHILISKAIIFETITYELKKEKSGTRLRLTTKYSIHSNLPFYGSFWSKTIINDFENNILSSLKKVIENERHHHETRH